MVVRRNDVRASCPLQPVRKRKVRVLEEKENGTKQSHVTVPAEDDETPAAKNINTVQELPPPEEEKKDDDVPVPATDDIIIPATVEDILRPHDD